MYRSLYHQESRSHDFNLVKWVIVGDGKCETCYDLWNQRGKKVDIIPWLLSWVYYCNKTSKRSIFDTIEVCVFFKSYFIIIYTVITFHNSIVIRFQLRCTPHRFWEDYPKTSDTFSGDGGYGSRSYYVTNQNSKHLLRKSSFLSRPGVTTGPYFTVLPPVLTNMSLS